MTGDIANVPAANPALIQARASLAANQVLTLFNAMAELIPPGENAKAEVVALKQVGQQFELLLRVLLANGSQVSVQATSDQPLTPGTRLLVTQSSPIELNLSLQQINNAANNLKTELDLRQVPVGTLLQAKVLTNQAIDKATGQVIAQPQGAAAALPATVAYRSIIILLNTALAGTSLSLESPAPLVPGSLLSARVQDSQALSFVPLPGRLDQLAVNQQLAAQQSRQGSLETLFKALQDLPRTQASLPPTVQSRIDTLLAGLPPLRQLTSPQGLAQALNASGMFMESRLLAGQDMAQLPDLKAGLLRLVAQLLPPGVPANVAYGAAAASNTLVRAMPSAIRNALGTLGQVAPRPEQLSFPLPARDVAAGVDKDDLELLLKLAAAAVSRIQSHQLGALEQTRSNADGTQVTTWQAEVPTRNAHEVVPLQVKIQREDPPPEEDQRQAGEDRSSQAREPLWNIDLAFDLEPLGPLQVHARLVRGTLSSQLWAQRESSAQLIEQELGHLRGRLVACGLTVGDLSCSHGAAPQGPRTQLEQRWIDENA